MLDYEDVPGEYDACEYVWGLERIKPPRFQSQDDRESHWV